jgi:hypothetical protein
LFRPQGDLAVQRSPLDGFRTSDHGHDTSLNSISRAGRPGAAICSSTSRTWRLVSLTLHLRTTSAYMAPRLQLWLASGAQRGGWWSSAPASASLAIFVRAGP